MDLRKFTVFAFLLNLGILATTVEGTQLFFSSLAVAIYMCRFLYLTKMLLFSSSNCFKILKLQSVETQFNSVEDFLFHLHFFREYTCSRSQLKQECLEVRSFEFIIVICLQMWGCGGHNRHSISLLSN